MTPFLDVNSAAIQAEILGAASLVSGTSEMADVDIIGIITAD